jgi:hypothetical protein
MLYFVYCAFETVLAPEKKATENEQPFCNVCLCLTVMGKHYLIKTVTKEFLYSYTKGFNNF